MSRSPPARVPCTPIAGPTGAALTGPCRPAVAPGVRAADGGGCRRAERKPRCGLSLVPRGAGGGCRPLRHHPDLAAPGARAGLWAGVPDNLLRQVAEAA